ncbi:late cornified envelope-like proline-rich protein 1 [Micropterus salmoides]|uniref:late cornified envelope-like proline-rich protein 1 n=1 Tax=Micropterus salmoides TaxID=27706 RepID=UPI0018ED5E26|nr:late cornified envelope-like proline-rich protein 1 [Micropterus salmoides]
MQRQPNQQRGKINQLSCMQSPNPSSQGTPRPPKAQRTPDCMSREKLRSTPRKNSRKPCREAPCRPCEPEAGPVPGQGPSPPSQPPPRKRAKTHPLPCAPGTPECPHCERANRGKQREPHPC